MQYEIWSSYNLDFADWEEDLKSNYPDVPESELVNLMYEINADYLEDEKTNLNIPLSNQIIMIADLGLWNGRRSGYKILKSKNINACFEISDCCDRHTIGIEDNDLISIGYHHDGVNRYRFRMLKNLSENKLDAFCDKLFFGTVTESDIRECTTSLAYAVANVYGWKLNGRGGKL